MSKPAWACGIAVVGSQWADSTLMLGVTKYLKLVYGFSIEYVQLQKQKHQDRLYAFFRKTFFNPCLTSVISLQP